MLRNRFRPVCLYTLLLIGVFTVVPFAGQAVRTTLGPAAEPRHETRARSDSRAHTRPDQPQKAKTATNTPSMSMTTAGVSVRHYSGRSYYRDGRRCHGRGCIRGKAPPHYYRSNPANYKNYYMYYNYYEGWS